MRSSGSNVRLIFILSLIGLICVGTFIGMGIFFLITSEDAVHRVVGPPGPSIIGPPGVCNLSDTSQIFVAGSIVVENITFNNTLSNGGNFSLTETDGCVSLNTGVKPLCLDVPYIATNIITNSTICLIPDCSVGITTIFDNTTNTTYIQFIGEVIGTGFTLPLLVGDSGFLDELISGPDKGLVIGVNNNGTLGITFDSNGYGLHGNETFVDWMTFLQVIHVNQGLCTKDDVFCINPELNNTRTRLVSLLNVIVDANTLELTSFNQTTITGPLFWINSTHVKIKNQTRLLDSNITFDTTNVNNPTGLWFYFNNSTIPSSWIKSIPTNVTCPLEIGPKVCINQLVLDTINQLIITNMANWNISSFVSNFIVNNITILGVFNLSGLSSWTNIYVTNNAIIGNTLVVSGPTTLAILTVGAGGLSVAAGAPFYAGGISTFASSTTFQGNVTFSLDPGESVTCASPYFTIESGCIEGCTNFYNCTNLIAIKLTARNGLSVATSTSDFHSPTGSLPAEFGTIIDHISYYHSLLDAYRLYSTNEIIMRSGRSGAELTTTGAIEVKSGNRTSITGITLLDVTFFPSIGCISPLRYTNGSGTFDIPRVYNATNNTCTSIEERYYLTNTTTHALFGFMGSVILKRTCLTYCTPFFDLFTKNLSFFMDIFDLGPITINHTLSTMEQWSYSQYVINQVVAGNGNGTFHYASALSALQMNTPSDTFEFESYSYVNTSGDDGVVSIGATNGLEVDGDILSPGGSTHPCCTGLSSSPLDKFIRYSYTGGLITITDPGGGDGEETIDWTSMVGGSSATLGSLSTVTFFDTNNSFTVTTNGIYEMTTWIQIDTTTLIAVTDIGCLVREQELFVDVRAFVDTPSYFASVFPQKPTGTTTLKCTIPAAYMTTALASTMQIQIGVLDPITKSTAYTTAHTLEITRGYTQITRVG